jgi:membrane associated rhomboid family serine protease
MFIPAILSLVMVLVFVLENGMGWDFHTAGIYPRRAENLWGIFTYIFIHGSVSHLFNNVLTFFILASCLYYFYNEIASKILLISLFISGLILWIIGRENWHIGASGLIYALAFFLAFSGIFRQHIPLIAISLIIVFVYGNMVWHIVPWQANDPISWEGHLSGVISGLILSVIYRKKGPQKPIKVWDEEGSDDEMDYMEEEVDKDNNNMNTPKKIEFLP